MEQPEQAEQAEQPEQPEATAEAKEIESSAARDAEFHGLDEARPVGIGHRFLIILAVLVSIAAILYIVNSWVHFV